MDKNGVLRICVNSSTAESEGEDSLSVSSYSSTSSSINPQRENGGYIKSRHSRNGGKIFCANPAELSSGVKNSGEDLNRSISMSSLSVLEDKTPSTAAREIRSLTNSYQTLLNKATMEIRKGGVEKNRLEREMESLLRANVELATESKKLLEEQREWRTERAGLMAANKEFVEEVERLYVLEEEWELERGSLKKKLEEERRREEVENKGVRTQVAEERKLWADEKSKLESTVEQLVASVKILTMDNAKLIKEREHEQSQASQSSQALQEQFGGKVLELEAAVSNLRTQLSGEGEERERLELELESLASELDKRINLEASREDKMEQLCQRTESLSAQLFETQMSKDSLCQEVEEQRERNKKMKVELDQVKVEREWLVSRGKENKGGGGAETDLEKLREDLRAEREKVSNLVVWKEQLVIKNKELVVENQRLVSRADDLEALMNDEVTDINELISVINNIQGSTGQLVDPSLLKRRSYK